MSKLLPIPKAVRDAAAARVLELYGFGDPGVKCYYAKSCPLSAWNATTYSDGRRSLIVLHGKFSRRERVGLYDRTSVLAHEFVHAFRVGKGETVFEEHLAYQTSPSRLRRTIGGAFRSPLQMILLFALAPLSIPYEFCQRRKFNRLVRRLRSRGDEHPLKTIVRMSAEELKDFT